jgi:ATP-binding cassette subfamily F protein uup
VATAILAFEGEGRVVRWEGNYADLAARRAAAPPPAPGTAAGSPAASRSAPPAGGSEPPRPRRPRKPSFHELRELEGIEARILEAEGRKGELEAALADPATYQKAGESVAGLRAELEVVSKLVDDLYERWQALEALRGA